MNPLITQEYLRSQLHYNPATGIFTWLITRKGVTAGTVAGYYEANGYYRIKLFNVLQGAHRLAWVYMTGQVPKRLIDHEDGDPSNNRWDNLREANQNQNHWNARMPTSNTSGVKGVTKQRFGKPWKAELKFNKKSYYFGTFDTMQEAERAAIAGRIKLHGEFARHD